MALRVWLPLNGNLNNQGLDDTWIETYGTTSFIDNGKIGKAYASGEQGDFKVLWTYPQTNKLTLCFWLKPNSNAGSWTDVFSFGDGHHRLERSSSGTYQYYVDSGNTALMPNGTTIFESLPVDQWSHITMTVDENLVVFYINGAQRAGAVATSTLSNVFGENNKGFFYFGCRYEATSYYKGNFNDIRIYDECLSQKQIKEISKGLVAHYPLNNRFNTNNLIINGFGELGGNIGWANSNVSTTEIPSGVSDVKASFYNGNSTINNNLYRIPICPTHSYTISAYIKSSGATSGSTYPSIFPYDIDKKFIDYFKCKSGFDSKTVTTLTQPLNPGDTKIYATDLSQWSTASNNYYYHVAIFGYTDSTGFLYPDLEYTQDSPVFGTYADKSHIDKTNNIITLNAAYSGKARPAGTTICQATEGSTYYYPFEGLALSSLTDWTFKTATIIPVNEHRLRYSRYWTYSTYSNTYHAAIKLIDNTWMNTEVTDCSGNGYNGIINGTLTYNNNNNSPRYEGCTKFDANTSYIKLPALTTWGFANSFTIIYWANIADMNGKMAWGFSDGNRLNIYPTGSVICCNTGDGANNPYQNNGSSIAYSQWNNGWHQFAMVADGSTNKLYVDGQYQGTAKTYKGITGTQMYISGWDTGTNYRWVNGSISDFRIYATALTANDILTLYKTSGIIDNKGNVYAYEFKEE